MSTTETPRAAMFVPCFDKAAAIAVCKVARAAITRHIAGSHDWERLHQTPSHQAPADADADDEAAAVLLACPKTMMIADARVCVASKREGNRTNHWRHMVAKGEMHV